MTRRWPSDRALLFVHGVGNAKPGDYANLVGAVSTALGAGASTFAIYELYYDVYNDWLAAKTGLADKLAPLVGWIRGAVDRDQGGGADGAELASSIADYAGDVLWPVLSPSARLIIQEAYLAQLKQIVLDGITAGVPSRFQQLSIICHSLGCFHTYEALHAAARSKAHKLQPVTDRVRFANVIMMASPTQMIRSVAEALGAVVPQRDQLHTLDGSALSLPSQARAGSGDQPSVARWVSVTGELDPVGGYFFRRRANWAYMSVPTQESIIDPQSALNVGSKAELATRLRSALREREAPDISITNPHSWDGYVARHSVELRQWLTA